MDESGIQTHYDNLQVKENAGDEVIKGAYRYLCQKWHPDRNPDNAIEAERILRMINRAYVVLSNPERRAEYDRSIALERAKPSPPPSPSPSSSGSAEGSSQSSEPASASGAPGESPMRSGMRWATFWIYFNLPFEALLCGVFAFILFGLSTPLGAILGAIFGGMALLQVWLCMQLRQGDHRAWVLNWIPICLKWIGGTLGVLTSGGFDRQESVARAAIYFVLGAIVWMWPNWVYWHKREELFTNANARVLCRQWIWAPVAIWAAQLVLLPVIGSQVLSAHKPSGHPSTKPAFATQSIPTRQSRVATRTSASSTSPIRSDEVLNSEARDRAWNEEIRAFMNSRDNDPILTRTESVALFNEQLNLVSQQYSNWSPAAIFRETTKRTVAMLEQSGVAAWEVDLREFLSIHCDVSSGNNKILFQESLNESAKPGMVNSQLLASAYDRVRSRKDFAHGANCAVERE